MQKRIQNIENVTNYVLVSEGEHFYPPPFIDDPPVYAKS